MTNDLYFYQIPYFMSGFLLLTKYFYRGAFTCHKYMRNQKIPNTLCGRPHQLDRSHKESETTLKLMSLMGVQTTHGCVGLYGGKSPKLQLRSGKMLQS